MNAETWTDYIGFVLGHGIKITCPFVKLAFYGCQYVNFCKQDAFVTPYDYTSQGVCNYRKKKWNTVE